MGGRRSEIDTGFAWVVLSAAFGLQVIFGMLTLNTGIVTTAILESVDSDLTRSSWVGSTLFATTFLMGPVAGIYHRKVGAKVAAFTSGVICLTGLTLASFMTSVIGLLCTYSFTTGCGLSISLNIVGAVPGFYFDKRRSIASAVLWTGSGFGMFLGSVLISQLLDTYSLGGALLILGAISLHICVAGVIFQNVKNHGPAAERTVSTEKKTETTESKGHVITEHCMEQQVDRHCDSGKEDQTDSPGSNIFGRTLLRVISLLRKNGFLMYNFSTLFWFIAESAIFLHLPNYAMSKGSTSWEARSLITILGITNIISKLLIGFASTDPDISIYLLYSGNMGLAGGLTLLLPFMSHEFYLQCIYATIFGMQLGGPNTLFSPITIDLIGLSDLELGFGIMTFFCGIGQLSGPPAASWIFDISKNYDFTFIFTGISLMTCSVCAAVIPALKKKNQTPEINVNV